MVFFFLSLLGCDNKQDVAQPPPDKEKKSVTKKTVTVKPAETQEPESPPEYVYNPEGSRDPFEPVIPQVRQIKGDVIPLTPLQKYDLNQFRIIGIILGKGGPVAMVVAPDNKSYVLKTGVKIGRNDGVVVGIESNSVVVEETYYDMSGVEQKTVQKIQLPGREGAK